MRSDETDEAVGSSPAAVGLVEPARAQLLAIADDVLSRLAVEDIPSGLRAVARFTPTKRRRLGATALAGVLETDEDFRERVARVATDAAPDLAAAVRESASDDGVATAAADPLDVAVLAYLTRPAGWQQVLAAANRRWREENATDSGSAAELERLRAEVTSLRATARGEAARLRDAAAEATAAAQDEIAALRRAVRERTRDLREAERERDEARAAEQDAARRLSEQDAAHDAELRRVRGRAAEADRAAEAARRGSRTEREFDDARLWLLVDTLVQAASGVRRELSLATPNVRPADGVSAADIAGAGRAVADPVALDALLAMPNVHLVVDGYNVTKTGYPDLALADQRARLSASLAALAGRAGVEVTIVWDGGARPPVQPPAPRGVRVLFSAADEIADDLIRRLVAAEPAGRPVLVVTSDQQIVTDTARAGVWSAPSAVLLRRLV